MTTPNDIISTEDYSESDEQQQDPQPMMDPPTKGSKKMRGSYTTTYKATRGKTARRWWSAGPDDMKAGGSENGERNSLGTSGRMHDVRESLSGGASMLYTPESKRAVAITDSHFWPHDWHAHQVFDLDMTKHWPRHGGEHDAGFQTHTAMFVVPFHFTLGELQQKSDRKLADRIQAKIFDIANRPCVGDFMRGIDAEQDDSSIFMASKPLGDGLEYVWLGAKISGETDCPIPLSVTIPGMVNKYKTTSNSSCTLRITNRSDATHFVTAEPITPSTVITQRFHAQRAVLGYDQRRLERGLDRSVPGYVQFKITNSRRMHPVVRWLKRDAYGLLAPETYSTDSYKGMNVQNYMQDGVMPESYFDKACAEIAKERSAHTFVTENDTVKICAENPEDFVMFGRQFDANQSNVKMRAFAKQYTATVYIDACYCVANATEMIDSIIAGSP